MNWLKREWKTVPVWSMWLAAAVSGAIWILMMLLFAGPLLSSGGVPVPMVALYGLLAGLFALLPATYVLTIGYVNADARRRGMRSGVWTAIAALIPNAVGILLYFLFREPLPVACPRCASPADQRLRFCPQCGQTLGPQCAACGRPTEISWSNCGHCGAKLARRDLTAA
ncbi:MAG: zinc ribbon domain-containing protein [Acidobacteria bacterium]|nr:zinc ribbon domain-containing protein [Acidobacteriota bacterium]